MLLGARRSLSTFGVGARVLSRAASTASTLDPTAVAAAAASAAVVSNRIARQERNKQKRLNERAAKRQQQEMAVISADAVSDFESLEGFPVGSAACVGCGAALQSVEEEHSGFVPPRLLHPHESGGIVPIFGPRRAKRAILSGRAADCVPLTVEQSVKLLQAETSPNPELDLQDDPDLKDIFLQSSTRLETPEFKNRKPQEKDLLCTRCFRLRYNGIATQVPVKNGLDEMKECLKQHEHALIVHVVDISDFPLSYVREVDQFAGNNPVLIVANKGDLLGNEHSTDPSGRIRDWLRKCAKYAGIKGFEDYAIRVVCARTGMGIKALAETIKAKRTSKENIIVVGRTNVGKSSLVNRLLSTMRRGTKPRTTTFHLPGTTVERISFLMEGDALGDSFDTTREKSLLFDTPGAQSASGALPYLNVKETRLLNSAKPFTATTYVLRPGRCLLFGGLARVDFIEGDSHAFFTVFSSNRIHIHPTKSEKVEALLAKHAGTDLLAPPIGDAERLKLLPPMSGHTFSIQGIGTDVAAADIVIGGLGWVSVAAREGVTVSVSVAQIGGQDMCLRLPLNAKAVGERGSRVRHGDRSRFFPK